MTFVLDQTTMGLRAIAHYATRWQPREYTNQPDWGCNHIQTRGSRAQGRSRRDEILTAAANLFERRGYYGTSLRMIARAAHITPSLLQKYYPTKELILEAFVERAVGEIDMFTTAMHKLISSTADTHELFMKIALSYITFVDRMRGFYLTWVASPEIVAPYAQALPQFISLNHDMVATVLAGRLSISHDDALHRVRIFFSALFAWVIYYNRVGITDASDDTMGDQLKGLVDALLCGDVH